MKAAGNWQITLSTPMGPQAMQMAVTPRGDGFDGHIESPMGNFEVAGSVSGDDLNWVMHAKKPIPLKVTFTATVDGDIMRGSAKMGFMGKADLTGERLSSRAFSPSASSAPDALLTENFVDPQFGEPYIEVDEQRSEPAPHRYIHGGFKGTDARFSFYFPPADQYEGRFFHNTYPMATTSDVGPFPIAFDVAMGNLGFTFASGAYYVQTNLGGADRAPPADPAIAAYRVNAAAAKFSREVAAGIYGEHRPYGYLFGGSGGSYQVMGAAENTSGVWDGFLPYVLGSPNAIPSMFTVRMHALRVLRQRNKFPEIMGAINPGGSGDPYVGLDDEEAAALREATSMGYPPRGWFNHETLTSGYFPNVAAVVPMLDPTYAEDFWSKPGYLGTDPRSRIGKLRRQLVTTVVEVLPGFPATVRLATELGAEFADAHLIVNSGAAEGKSAPLAGITGDLVKFAYAADPTIGPSLVPGDNVRIDNSWALALQTYQRHQVPEPGEFGELYAWDQFRDAAGNSTFPQRDVLTGPVGAAGTAGSVPEGCITGKVLVIECLMDIDALPWQADWYRNQVKAQLGADFEDKFVLWFIDHAQHDNPPTGVAQAHVVSFEGALQQGLRDLSAWVENGVRPAETRYEVTDAQVSVPPTAAQRGGVQPVVELHANGAARADVSVGQPVTFAATIEVPSGAGQIISAEWDFEGTGAFPVSEIIGTPVADLRISATHCYTLPGTYFAVVRATSQRQGDVETAYGRVQNIARVRVVVS